MRVGSSAKDVSCDWLSVRNVKRRPENAGLCSIDILRLEMLYISIKTNRL